MKTRTLGIGRSLGLAAFALAMFVGQLTAYGAQIGSTFSGPDLGDWYIHHTVWSAVHFKTNAADWLAAEIKAQVGVASTDDAQGGIYLQIYSDLAGHPGIPMGGKFKTTGTIFTSSIKTFADESPGSTHLSASTDYWVVFAVEPTWSSNPRFQMTNLSPGEGPASIYLGILGSGDHGGSWSPIPAGAASTLSMQINGVQIGVPEPSSAMLAALCFVGLAVWTRRRKR